MRLQESHRLFWQAARRTAPPEAIESCFCAAGRRSPLAAMEVYAGAYFIRQLKAIKEFLPQTAALLSDDFDKLGRKYILEHPGQRAALETFPQQFSTFLCQEHRLFESEVAELEIARAQTLLAGEDPPPLAPEHFGQLTPDSRLKLIAAHRFCHVSRKAYRRFLSRPAPEPEEGPEQKIHILLHRRGYAVCTRSLDDDELRALSSLTAPRTVLEICANFCDVSDAVNRAHKFISLLLQNELLIQSKS